MSEKCQSVTRQVCNGKKRRKEPNGSLLGGALYQVGDDVLQLVVLREGQVLWLRTAHQAVCLQTTHSKTLLVHHSQGALRQLSQWP